MGLVDTVYGAGEALHDHNPVTMAVRSDFVENEIERGKEDWAETKADPAGEFRENLLFGATGPAPSIDENFDFDYGGGDHWLEQANREAWRQGTGTEPPDSPGDNPPDVPSWVRRAVQVALALLAVFAVGQLFTVAVSVGE